MARGKFRCARCKRTFSMAAHLARHKSTIHASKSKKKAGAKRKTRRRRTVKRAGRPKGVAARLKLQGLTLEQLGQLIAAARVQARRKMSELKKALK